MTTDPDTARKALGQLVKIVGDDPRYYPKAKSEIMSDLWIVSSAIITDPLTITETVVQASQRLRVNLHRFRPSVSVAQDSTVFLYSLVWPVIEGNDPVDYRTVHATITPPEEYRP